jgi:hypothetical protein
MIFDSFLFSKLTDALSQALLQSFDRLRPDTIAYNKTGATTRYRSFGAFRRTESKFIPANDLLTRFNTPKDYHTAHARPNPLDDELVASNAMQLLLDQIAPCLPIPLDSYAVGINQIRVVADDERMGSPAPGLHQDGYDFSCHLAIARRNVAGGISIVAKSPRPDDVVIEQCLNPGEFLFFNDRALYHTATPVTCRIGGTPAARDMLIVDFVRLAA